MLCTRRVAPVYRDIARPSCDVDPSVRPSAPADAACRCRSRADAALVGTAPRLADTLASTLAISIAGADVLSRLVVSASV